MPWDQSNPIHTNYIREWTGHPLPFVQAKIFGGVQSPELFGQIAPFGAKVKFAPGALHEITRRFHQLELHPPQQIIIHLSTKSFL